jgi:hypothetical protein
MQSERAASVAPPLSAKALFTDSFEPARIMATQAPAAVETKAQAKARFDAADAVGGAWYSDGPNGRNGDLAWGTSYVMTAYVEMFHATGDVRYLDKLAKMGDDVLKQRDSVRGVRDYRGDLKPAWQNGAYSSKPMAMAVHTGMIAAPIVEFANAVKQHPELANRRAYDGETFAQKAKTFIEAGEAAAAIYNEDWRESGDKGHYIFPADSGRVYTFAGREMPLNQEAALGTLLVALSDATGKAEWKDKATKLAKNFQQYLGVTANGGYAWNYWPTRYTGGSGEDVSHGAITMQFALRAADSGIVFGDEDVKRFVKTLDGQIHKNGGFSGYVGGNGGGAPSEQISRFGVLGKYDPVVHTIVSPILAGRDRFSASVLLGMAYVVRNTP